LHGSKNSFQFAGFIPLGNEVLFKTLSSRNSRFTGRFWFVSACGNTRRITGVAPIPALAWSLQEGLRSDDTH
jgi:hypothetical protein